MTSAPFARADDQCVRIDVRLTPKGGRDAIDGIAALADGRVVLKARVRAAPEKGAANAALEALLADRLGVSRSAVRLVSGATARQKTIEIRGEPNEIMPRLEAILEG